MTHLIDSALIQSFEAGTFGLPIASENRKYDPSPNTPWAELFVVPNIPSVDTLGDGGADIVTGFMQVNLNFPAEKGAGEAKQKATDIRNHFKAGTRITYNDQQVEIINAGRGLARNVNSWYQVIVTIQWRAWVNR